jgi:hypothetical protein
MCRAYFSMLSAAQAPKTVPEGRLTIARRFNAGYETEFGASPVGATAICNGEEDEVSSDET